MHTIYSSSGVPPSVRLRHNGATKAAIRYAMFSSTTRAQGVRVRVMEKDERVVKLSSVFIRLHTYLALNIRRHRLKMCGPLLLFLAPTYNLLRPL